MPRRVDPMQVEPMLPLGRVLGQKLDFASNATNFCGKTGVLPQKQRTFAAKWASLKLGILLFKSGPLAKPRNHLRQERAKYCR